MTTPNETTTAENSAPGNAASETPATAAPARTPAATADGQQGMWGLGIGLGVAAVLGLVTQSWIGGLIAAVVGIFAGGMYDSGRLNEYLPESMAAGKSAGKSPSATGTEPANAPEVKPSKTQAAEAEKTAAKDAANAANAAPGISNDPTERVNTSDTRTNVMNAVVYGGGAGAVAGITGAAGNTLTRSAGISRTHAAMRPFYRPVINLLERHPVRALASIWSSSPQFSPWQNERDVALIEKLDRYRKRPITAEELERVKNLRERLHSGDITSDKIPGQFGATKDAQLNAIDEIIARGEGRTAASPSAGTTTPPVSDEHMSTARQRVQNVRASFKNVPPSDPMTRREIAALTEEDWNAITREYAEMLKNGTAEPGHLGKAIKIKAELRFQNCSAPSLSPDQPFSPTEHNLNAAEAAAEEVASRRGLSARDKAHIKADLREAFTATAGDPELASAVKRITPAQAAEIGAAHVDQFRNPAADKPTLADCIKTTATPKPATPAATVRIEGLNPAEVKPVRVDATSTPAVEPAPSVTGSESVTTGKAEEPKNKRTSKSRGPRRPRGFFKPDVVIACNHYGPGTDSGMNDVGQMPGEGGSLPGEPVRPGDPALRTRLPSGNTPAVQPVNPATTDVMGEPVTPPATAHPASPAAAPVEPPPVELHPVSPTGEPHVPAPQGAKSTGKKFLSLPKGFSGKAGALGALIGGVEMLEHSVEVYNSKQTQAEKAEFFATMGVGLTADVVANGYTAGLAGGAVSTFGTTLKDIRKGAIILTSEAQKAEEAYTSGKLSSDAYVQRVDELNKSAEELISKAKWWPWETVKSTTPGLGVQGYIKGTVATWDLATKTNANDFAITGHRITDAVGITNHYGPKALKSTPEAGPADAMPDINSSEYKNLNVLRIRFGFTDKDMTDNATLEQYKVSLQGAQIRHKMYKPTFSQKYLPEWLGGQKADKLNNDAQQWVMVNAALREMQAYQEKLTAYKNAYPANSPSMMDQILAREERLKKELDISYKGVASTAEVSPPAGTPAAATPRLPTISQ